MGRKPKEREKRVSGTGLTKAEAAPMKYKRIATDGSYEIDTDTIKDKINAYISDKDKVISIAGLLSVLGIRSHTTLSLWGQGYTSTGAQADKDVIPNYALADAVAQGVLAVARYYEERSDKYTTQKDIMALKSLGIFTDKVQVDVAVSGAVSLGKWGKFSK